MREGAGKQAPGEQCLDGPSAVPMKRLGSGGLVHGYVGADQGTSASSVKVESAASNRAGSGSGKTMVGRHWEPAPGADSPLKEVPQVFAERQSDYVY